VRGNHVLGRSAEAALASRTRGLDWPGSDRWRHRPVRRLRRRGLVVARQRRRGGGADLLSKGKHGASQHLRAGVPASRHAKFGWLRGDGVFRARPEPRRRRRRGVLSAHA
jgi:hypothetical protein